MPAPSTKPVVTARDREMRRVRIMGMVQAGFSYESIAQTEHISRERVRKIVVKALEEGTHGPRVDPRLLQAARLEPALRLAARAIAEGKLEGVDRLLKVLDRLDKCGAVAVAASSGVDYRQRLLEKFDSMAARSAQPSGPDAHPPASKQNDA
jgi:hypothetical protein